MAWNARDMLYTWKIKQTYYMVNQSNFRNLLRPYVENCKRMHPKLFKLF